MFKRWEDPESTFEILKQLTAGRPCDMTGIEGYTMLNHEGGIQWPYSTDSSEGKFLVQERRLFEDGQFYHPDKKAKFLFDPVLEAPELPDGSYPFWLLTGRGTSAQWHTQTRTSKSPILNQLAPKCAYIEIHPSDARRLRISHEETITIASRRGVKKATAKVMATVQPGQVFMPMHYREVNQLTHPSFDTHSHQPSYKACAVQISKTL